MLVLATLGEPRLRVSTEELTRAGRSYTIDTLERLRRAGGRRRWFFLAGSDAFVEIDSWKNARLVLDRVEFIVFPRQGAGAAALRRRLPAWVTRRLVEHTEADLPLAAPATERSAGPRVHWVPLRAPAVSSSEVRRRAARGENLDGLVPELVGHYIAQYRLYRRGKAAAA
jgi:nicotinate-nucleotide adenylyltransferase